MEEIVIPWLMEQASNHGGFFTFLVAIILPIWQRVKAHISKLKASVDKQVEAFEAYRTAQLDHEKEMIEILKDIKSNTRQ